MPFKSVRQQRWEHTPAGTKALGGAAKVKEWDQATDFNALPMKVGVAQSHPAHPTARRARQRTIIPTLPDLP